MKRIILPLIILCACFSASANRTVWGLQSGVWKATDTVYIIEGDVTVPRGLSLTLEPGVIVKFNGDYSIIVEGDLFVDGTGAQRVVFTSFADDGYGGDSNKDGLESGPTAMDWSGIKINEPNSKSHFKNCRIQYSLAPFISFSKLIEIDSLYLSDNSTDRIIVGTDTIKTFAKTPFIRLLTKAVTAAPEPVVQKIEETEKPWYRTPVFWGVSAATVGAVIIYAVTGKDETAGPSSTAIENPPLPPQ